MIPLKMMYYPDFFLFPHPLPRPRLSRLLQLGFKRNKLVATPLIVLENQNCISVADATNEVVKGGVTERAT